MKTKMKEETHKKVYHCVTFFTKTKLRCEAWVKMPLDDLGFQQSKENYIKPKLLHIR